VILGGRVSKREQTRSRILSAAWQLFTENGYEKTSTRDISSAAGVATGTVFSHFPNKLDLLKSGLETQLNKLLVETAKSDTSTTPIDRLLHFASALYPFYLSQREFSKVLFKEILWQSQSLDPQLNAFKHQLAFGDEQKLAYADVLMDVYFMTLLSGLNDDAENEVSLITKLKEKLRLISVL
jgi:AcrR family transcriptional regulator